MMFEDQLMHQKIVSITMTIRTEYPELAKNIEKMRATIPEQGAPAISKRTLQSHYNSLDSLLSKYILEHPGKRTLKKAKNEN